MYALRRSWLDFKRHLLAVVLIVLFFTLIVAFLSVIYPGPDFVESLMEVPIFQVLIGGIVDVDNPGFLVWFLIILSIFQNLIYSVIGIFIGARILPFNEKDGKELIFSTEKNLISYYLENFILVTMIIIPVSILPAYLLGIGFLLANGGGITSLTIAFVTPIFFTYVVVGITSLGSVIWSSSKTGYVFGGVFFIISFTLNLLQQELDFVKDLNLMTQMDVLMKALQEEWNTDFMLKTILITAFLVILSIFFLFRTDFIKKRSSLNETADVNEKTRIGSIIKRSSFIRAPVETILSKTGWKYPSFRDQLQSSAGILLIYLVVTSGLLLIIVIAYPGDIYMAELFSGLGTLFDSPMIGAFLFGHSITPTLEGFLLYKIMIFHWIYYGPFLFIITFHVLMRDSSAGYDEITWSMPQTRTKIIVERTVASIVYLWIIILANFVTLYSTEIILVNFSDYQLSDFTATFLAFFFLGLGYSIFLILFIAIASIPRPKFILLSLATVFIVAIFVPLFFYMNQDLTWLQYLSPFYYFDVAGIMLSDVAYEKVIPEIIVYGVVIISFFVLIIKLWIPKKDIL
ncbi:MAG: hypothetical protein ACTSP4_05790 [Candidatus Hodarchaeales archaeon]